MATTSNFLSPGINIREIDLTSIVPASATSIGAFAGPFEWGPASEIITISSEDNLVSTFSKPSDNIAQYWFSAANFLSYASNLKVVRVLGANSNNAVSNTTAGAVGVQVKNETDYTQNFSIINNINTADSFVAKYAGSIGNSLNISICPNRNTFAQNLTSVRSITTNNAITIGSNSFTTTSSTIGNFVAAGDFIAVKNGNASLEYKTVTQINSNTVFVDSVFTSNIANTASLHTRWKYYSAFTDSPTTSSFVTTRGGLNDEMHIVLVDEKGLFSGIKGLILEKFAFVSKARDAKTPDGTSNYYVNVLNGRSQYVWWLKHPPLSGNWGNTSIDTTFTENTSFNQNYYQSFSKGVDELPSVGELQQGYSLFSDSDTSDVSLIISGPASTTLSNYLVAMTESRSDAVVFISPQITDVVDNYNGELNSCLETRNALTSSSFGFMDCNWKYQYDKYNDKYRWIPLNGDIAGLTARTDQERDPWYSPAGFNRGVIKNVVKLAWNPNKAQRDSLYQKGINPVVTFPGEGTMLYGDKTLLSRPSAFDRINVRRLFNTLEKSISKAARATLFEFNDQFTRVQFISLVEPYLRDVKGRRGITDFRVVCDETNNTSEVIDRNEFVGDIYIKPTRSINYIQLSFVAVRTGVSFSEIVGSI